MGQGVKDWLDLEEAKETEQYNEGKITRKKSRDEIWEEFLTEMETPTKDARDIATQAAAVFYAKDILVMSETNTYQLDGSFHPLGQVAQGPPMTIVHMGGGHFQSVHKVEEESDPVRQQLPTQEAAANCQRMESMEGLEASRENIEYSQAVASVQARCLEMRKLKESASRQYQST